MIEIITDPLAIRPLAAEWNKLAEPFQTPLLCNEWIAACAEAFYQPGRLRVILKRGRHGIEAIAALGLVKNRGSKKLELLGTSLLYEPSGFIYKDERSLEVLLHYVMKMKRPVQLSRLRAESPELLLLKTINNKSCFSLFRNNSGSPSLPITPTLSWVEFESSMPSRRRYDLRRAKKRAESLGMVEFEITCPTPDHLDNYLDEFFLVEAAGWKGRAETALLFDNRLKCFFSLYSRSASRLGILRFCFLRINGKPAAVLLAIQHSNRFWILKVGYDETYSRCSPGILLMNETIRYAFDNKLDSYEFLGTDAPWIHMWTDQKRPDVTARVYPFSMRGQLALAMDAAFAVKKKIRKTCGQ